MALITSEMQTIKNNPRTWTQEMAESYLKTNKFSKTDIYFIINNCSINQQFNSNLFGLFVKGYETKRDPNFAMVAYNYAAGGEDGFDYAMYAKIYTIAKKIPQMTMDQVGQYFTASDEEINALFYVADKFPEINPFKIMELAKNYRSNESLNFDNYNKIVGLLEEGVSFDAVREVYDTSLKEGNIFDSNVFDKINQIANAAIERKEIFFSVHLFSRAYPCYTWLCAPKPLNVEEELCCSNRIFTFMR